VQVGRDEASTLHLVMLSCRFGVQKMLSRREYLLELMWCKVGTPLGSAITISYSASSSISFSAALCDCLVNRRVSSSLSHSGWCRLKSPAHIMDTLLPPMILLACVWRKVRSVVSVLEWVQSL